MKKGIIGKKIGMTQIFDEAGNVVPVTVIEAGPCVVVQKKTTETDGYDSVQLGFEDIADKSSQSLLQVTLQKQALRLRDISRNSALMTQRQ